MTDTDTQRPEQKGNNTVSEKIPRFMFTKTSATVANTKRKYAVYWGLRGAWNRGLAVFQWSAGEPFRVRLRVAWDAAVGGSR